MLVFSNSDPLDPILLRTFGASIKPNSDSPIGEFGTGLKHSIATILRGGGKLTLQSGPDTFTFHSQEELVRGEPIQLVYMKDRNEAFHPLGFTLNLGKNWQPWMVYRELYSNTMDEQGRISTSLADVPTFHQTVIQVQWPALDEIYAKRHEFFLTSPPLYSIPGLSIHAGPSKKLFYHGIFAGELSLPSRYTYNFTGRITLTEDRTIPTYQAVYKLAELVPTIKSPDILRTILTANSDCFEHTIPDYGIAPSEEFQSVAAKLAKHSRAEMSNLARGQLERHSPEELFPPAQTPTPLQAHMILRAKEFCAQIGEPVSCPIIIVAELGEGIDGLASKGICYLSESAFQKGTKYLAETLLEEHLHIKYNLKDCSRAMQNKLFELLGSSYEILTGGPL